MCKAMGTGGDDAWEVRRAGECKNDMARTARGYFERFSRSGPLWAKSMSDVERMCEGEKMVDKACVDAAVEEFLEFYEFLGGDEAVDGGGKGAMPQVFWVDFNNGLRTAMRKYYTEEVWRRLRL
mmetsp:Transcript_2988/g.7811  ORF Transcript_2988/g.7811 Transcript_2988/m.7811 type:complete len:124 (+) Transcript_2988:2-373(+)